MTVTKEYRIVLPITVGEYQVAQLYSVAESSKVNQLRSPSLAHFSTGTINPSLK